MAYNPENNPYIPGDPYSYDLKWIVAELKRAIELYTPISQEVQDLYDFVHDYFQGDVFEAQLDAALRVLASDGTLATIIQPLFDEYKIDVDAEIANMIQRIDDQDSAIDVLEGRMDTFASLPPGSTSGNAELLDIRVSYKGVTYPSAGDATRGQAQEIFDALVSSMNSGIHYNGAAVQNGVYPYVDFIFPFKSGEQFFIRVNSITGGDLNHVEITTRAGVEITTTRVLPAQLTHIIGGIANTNVEYARLIFRQNSDPGISINVDFDIVNMDNLMQSILQAQYIDPLNCFIGSDNKNLIIDTSAKTITIKAGIWTPKIGRYVNFATDHVFNYASYTVDPSNPIVDFYYNRTTQTVEIKPHHNFDVSGDFIVLFTVYVKDPANWTFGKTDVYFANEFTESITIYADSSQKKASFNTNNHTARIFKKIVCVGDSYTEGYIVDSGGVVHTDMQDYSWPTYISKSTGNEWKNAGKTGATTRTYLSTYLSLALSYGKPQAYVIGLMINDATGNPGTAVPVGTPADIGTTTDSYYGNLSHLIRELHTFAPDAFIFVNTCPREYLDNTYSPYNQAVRDICAAYASTYNTHCIDLEADTTLFMNNSFIDDANNGHYSAAGYEQMAEIYEYVLSSYINKSPLVFRDVPFIDYDA